MDSINVIIYLILFIKYKNNDGNNDKINIETMEHVTGCSTLSFAVKLKSPEAFFKAQTNNFI